MSVLLVVLSVLDVLLTVLLLNRYGAELEFNPIAAWVYQQFSVTGMVGLKAAAVAFAVGVYKLSSVARPEAGARFTAFACRPWLRTTFVVCACSTTALAVLLGLLAHSLGSPGAH
jgi:hypothetical protein